MAKDPTFTVGKMVPIDIYGNILPGEYVSEPSPDGSVGYVVGVDLDRGVVTVASSKASAPSQHPTPQPGPKPRPRPRSGPAKGHLPGCHWSWDGSPCMCLAPAKAQAESAEEPSGR